MDSTDDLYRELLPHPFIFNNVRFEGDFVQWRAKKSELTPRGLMKVPLPPPWVAKHEILADDLGRAHQWAAILRVKAQHLEGERTTIPLGASLIGAVIAITVAVAEGGWVTLSGGLIAGAMVGVMIAAMKAPRAAAGLQELARAWEEQAQNQSSDISSVIDRGRSIRRRRGQRLRR